MKERVTILTSRPQEHGLVLAVVDRLLENGVAFRGFRENELPGRWSPECLDGELVLLDGGILAQMSGAEKKMLAEFARRKVVRKFDDCADPDDRALANLHAELVVNGALSEADLGPGDVPEQDPEVTCRFARDRAEASLRADGKPFSEFTLHSLRALAGDREKLLRLLPPLFDAQDPDFIPRNHDELGAWCYAPLCARLTGDARYSRNFLRVLDRTMRVRPYLPGGIMAGAGRADDPLNLRGERPFYEPHCARDKLVYNEMFHFHGPVFAAAALASGDRRYLDGAMKLMRHLRDVCADPADGLPRHYGKDGLPRGWKWSRGIAHILHGIALMFEVWPDLPEAEARELAGFADAIGEGLLRTQDPSGLWHNIADEPVSPLESSGTAAFLATYRMLVRCGRLPEAKYGEMLAGARSGLLRRCYRGGFAGNCAGTGCSIGRDYYIRRPFNFLFTGQIVPALADA